MKKLLFLAAFCSALAASDFGQAARLPCFIAALSEHFIACKSGEIFELSGLKNIAKSRSGVKFIDENGGDFAVLSEQDGIAHLELFRRGSSIKSILLEGAIFAAFMHPGGIITISAASEISFYDEELNLKNRLNLSFASSAAAAISPDKSTLAVADEGGSVYLINLKTQKITQKAVHKDKINCIDLSNSQLLSASTDRSVVILDYFLDTKERFEAPSLVYFCALSEGGKYAYSCDDEANICTKERKLNVGNEYINSLKFIGEELYLNAYSTSILKEIND